MRRQIQDARKVAAQSMHRVFSRSLLRHPWPCSSSCWTKRRSLPRSSVNQRLAPRLSRAETATHVFRKRLTRRTDVDWYLRYSQLLSNCYPRVVNRCQPVRSLNYIDRVSVPASLAHTLPQSFRSPTPSSRILAKPKLIRVSRIAVVYQYRRGAGEHIVRVALSRPLRCVTYVVMVLTWPSYSTGTHPDRRRSVLTATVTATWTDYGAPEAADHTARQPPELTSRPQATQPPHRRSLQGPRRPRQLRRVTRQCTGHRRS